MKLQSLALLLCSITFVSARFVFDAPDCAENNVNNDTHFETPVFQEQKLEGRQPKSTTTTASLWKNGFGYQRVYEEWEKDL